MIPTDLHRSGSSPILLGAGRVMWMNTTGMAQGQALMGPWLGLNGSVSVLRELLVELIPVDFHE
jgi:hypothetical protein